MILYCSNIVSGIEVTANISQSQQNNMYFSDKITVIQNFMTSLELYQNGD